MSAIVAAAPRLGLAAEEQPGGKACMSDDQLRLFLADVMFWQLQELSEVCQRKLPAMADEVIAGRRTFEEKALNIRYALTEEVLGILRPFYGAYAFAERVGMLSAASKLGVEYAEANWTPTECSNMLESSQMIGNELTATSVGDTITGLIDAGFEDERALVPRCS